MNWDTDDTWSANQPENPMESTISYVHPTPVLESKPGQIAVKTNRPQVLFKIIPGTTPARPDFSKYEMVPGAPAAFKVAMQKAKELKAAKLAFEAGLQNKKAIERAASQSFSEGNLFEQQSPVAVAGAGKVIGLTAGPSAGPVDGVSSRPINTRTKP